MEAALVEFADKGFKGATIKGIARTARLRSPALIYHYFDDKAALFREIIEAEARNAPFMELINDQPFDEPPREVLQRLGQGLLRFIEERRQTVRILVSEAIRDQELTAAWFVAGPGKVLGFLEEYLGRQVELGRLRAHDTRSSARSFVGMLIPQVVARLLLPAAPHGPTDQAHLDLSVDIFLAGLEPGR